MEGLLLTHYRYAVTVTLQLLLLRLLIWWVVWPVVTLPLLGGCYLVMGYLLDYDYHTAICIWATFALGRRCYDCPSVIW